MFQQPLASETPSATFKDNILALNSEGIAHIISNPLALVSLYSAGLISTFASHVQLCHRNWSVAYEPYAHTSVAFGYAYHRDAVRRLARQYGTHLRYINHTLLSLKRFTSFNQTSSDGIPTLQPLIRDFEHFANEIGEMKKDCHLFLEQQVSKLALQDARLQMREARDLKRISYLAFIFVPLSLTSSFFGMNVKELDSGPTPVWKFAVTAIAVLVTSGFVLWASRSGTVWAQRLYQRRWWKSKDLLPVQAPAQLDGPAPKSKRLLSFLLRESAVALDRSAGSVMPNYGKLPDNFYGSPASCVPSNLPGPPANYMDPAYTPNAIHPISGQ